MTTLDRLWWGLQFCAALGCGVVGGVFFAFSTFVMPALARLSPPQGIAAMQVINITAINAWFMTVLFGAGALCLVLTGFALFNWPQPGSGYWLMGSLIYFIGNVLVTIVCNVPLNNALAQVEPHSTAGAQLWSSYLTDWTRWNHVRTLTALIGAALLTFGLCF